MDRDAGLTFITRPVHAPDYRGMSGEQAFYDTLRVNLGWFEREMRAAGRLLGRRPVADAGHGQTVAAWH